MEIGVLLRLIGVMNLILILRCPFHIQGKEPCLCDFVKNKTKQNKTTPPPQKKNDYKKATLLHWLVFRHLLTDFFLTWYDDRDGATKLYILLSDWMTLTLIQGHSCMRNQQLRCHFLENFVIDLDKIEYVAATCCLLKIMLNCLCASNIPRREFC